MTNALQVLETMGIGIGKEGGSAEEVRLLLMERGAPVAIGTVGQMRRGHNSGAVTAQRLLLAERLRTDDASLKNAFCERLAAAGVGKMPMRAKSSSTQVIGCQGFMQILAQATGVTEKLARIIVREMRADLAYSQGMAPELAVGMPFKDAAEAFLFGHHLAGSHYVRPGIRALGRESDHQTVPDWYRTFNAVQRGNLIAGWTPYEARQFRNFYQLQAARGNHLTALDRLVIERAEATSHHLDELQVEIWEVSGVLVSRDSLRLHRHLLAFGLPATPLRRFTGHDEASERPS